MKIDFVGESAIDTGGPSREFWRLLGKEISEKMFIGVDPQRRTLAFNTDYLLQSKYFAIGRLFAMGLCQGASGFPFLAPYLYKFICKPNILDIVTEEDVADLDVRNLVSGIKECGTDEELMALITNSSNEFFFNECGNQRPLHSATLAWKKHLMKMLNFHFAIGKLQGAINQFREGLASRAQFKNSGTLLRLVKVYCNCRENSRSFPRRQHHLHRQKKGREGLES
eukprot:m.272869 g.272869  ORF g.272869 m.272869 type:complete len:225 (+) comp40568_c0_seq10:1915-2589(+)